MYYVTKVFKFEGAHMLNTAYSKECRNIHGHSYKVSVTFGAEKLNSDGMVVDFKRVKGICGHIIDNLDHALVLHSDDYGRIMSHNSAFSELNLKIRTLGAAVNPTAENMAEYFYDEMRAALSSVPELRHGVFIESVEVQETETGAATFNGREG